jgi:uncharacterized repeat protein (TIGR01451 family)
MKNLFNFAKYLPKRFLGILLVLAFALIPALSSNAALPGADRPVKEYQGPGTPGFDYPTFNSFTNVPNIGDERNFVTGKIAGAEGGFYDPMTKLRNGDEILVRVYVHNGADPSLNDQPGQPGVAKNTRVRIELPGSSQTARSHTLTGYVSSDTAKPDLIADSLSMEAENDGFFSLAYMPGSTQLTLNDAGGNPVTSNLPDGIAAGGLSLGDIKGCFEFVQLVTFKVKVSMPRYSVAKTVRMKGQGPNDWQESVTAKPGDEVEWRVEFKNVGDTQLNKVAIVDELPDGVTVVGGSVQLENSNTLRDEDGDGLPYYTFPDDQAVQGRQINVEIGDYLPESNAFVYFNTTVDGQAEPECGVRPLTNKAFATPEGYGAVVDDASVKVDSGTICEDQVSFSCDGLSATKVTEREYKFTVDASTVGNAQIQEFIFDFGDGQKAVTSANTTNHTYAGPGKFKASAKVVTTAGTTTETCEVEVTVNRPPTKTLPRTGPAEMAGVTFGTSALGMGLRNWLRSKRALRSALLDK